MLCCRRRLTMHARLGRALDGFLVLAAMSPAAEAHALQGRRKMHGAGASRQEEHSAMTRRRARRGGHAAVYGCRE
jgi:hypothetical protein